ncbi:MAG: hypothetical protein HYZ83_03525, partial [Candidatus Omnitrophica bacterium]|nr:hypothetical protein [Candidatus Omnitrophota bacterium]
FNNDGGVDADDISLLEQLVEARRMFMGNVNLDDLLKRVDFNKDGRVDGADQTILEQNVAQFSVVDVTGDGKLDQQDLDRLKTVLDLVKVIQQIQPSSIITRDLNGDNIIDQRDAKLALEYLNALVDVNGDGKADAGMLDALLADVRKIQTFQPPVETWDPADLNNDRKVDIQDVRKFLENLGSYVFKDLNKDGQENSKDLEIAKRLIDYVYQNANYSPETLVLADLDQDGRVDSQDAAIADAFRDLDGDGAVNEQDVALAQYLVFRGKIGQGDLNLVRRMLGAQAVRQDAIQAVRHTALDTVGPTLISNAVNGSFRYQMNILESGMYQVGIALKSYDKMVAAGFVYPMDIYVDGEYAGSISVEGSYTDFKRGSLELDLSQGLRTIEFVSRLPRGEEHRMQVREVFANPVGDINLDGVVESYDLEIIETVVANSSWSSANEPAILGMLDVNHDTVINSTDASMVRDAVRRMQDVTGDQIKDNRDTALIKQIAALSLFRSIPSGDIDRDGLVSNLDAENLRGFLDSLYLGLNVSSQEQAVADINDDGVVNFVDIDLLLKANSFYEASDITGDGSVDELDILRLEGILQALYSKELITGEIIGRADLTGIDQNGDGVGEKDGFIREEDVALFEKGLRLYKDITEDGVVNQDDLALINRIKQFVGQSSNALTGLTAMDGRAASEALRRLNNVIYRDKSSRLILQNIYEQPFTANTDGWTFDNNGDWKRIGDQLVQDRMREDDVVSRADYAGEVEDFYMTVRFRFDSGEGAALGRGGIIFRENAATGDSYDVAVMGHTVVLRKKTAGHYQVLGAAVYDFAEGYHDITIKAVGDKIEVILDGENRLISVMDGSLERGKTALYTERGTIGRFDRVSIQSARQENVDAALALLQPLSVTDFSTEAITGWQAAVDGGVWKVKDGKLSETNAGGSRYTLWQQANNVEDFVFEGDITLNGSQITPASVEGQIEGRKAGILFASKDGNSYRLEINADASKVELFRHVDGQDERIGYGIIGIKNNEQAYHIQIKRSGGLIRISVDNKELMRVSDLSLAGGHLGIFTDKKTLLSIDNVRYQQIKALPDIAKELSLTVDVDGNGTINGTDYLILDSLNKAAITDFNNDKILDEKDAQLF